MKRDTAVVAAKQASFYSKTGAREYFLTFESPFCESFPKEVEHVYQEYLHTIEELGLSNQSPVFARVFLSDIANQHRFFTTSELCSFLRSGAVSLVQQPPCGGGNIALLAYHIEMEARPTISREKSEGPDFFPNHLVLKGNSYTLLFSGGHFSPQIFDSYRQTTETFTQFAGLLRNQGLNLLQNTVRTWVFVRDIDNHYKKMTRSRGEFFQKEGLTDTTRFIASTGIEAQFIRENALVSLDAISIGGLKKEQIVRMEALNNLCPTNAYGVTFERGTRIDFGDRAHLYISGTASIDRRGNVLFEGDVARQTQRTLDNISALLSPHQATLRDMMYFLVYLRNPKEARHVEKIIRKNIPASTPVIMVAAPVCRPTWLVEIEGIAIIKAETNFPSFF